MWCGKMGLPDMSQEMEIFGRIERQECEVSRIQVRDNSIGVTTYGCNNFDDCDQICLQCW